MRSLQKSQKRSIISSKPYFELKVIKMAEMDEKRNKVNEIEQKLHISKSDYQAALRTLETISEQIHLHRKLQSLESNLSVCVKRSYFYNSNHLTRINWNICQCRTQLEAGIINQIHPPADLFSQI